MRRRGKGEEGGEEGEGRGKQRPRPGLAGRPGGWAAQQVPSSSLCPLERPEAGLGEGVGTEGENGHAMCGSGATPFPCLTAWLHLRAWPDPVFEGDALTLRCHGSTNKALSQVQFYKDGKLLQTPKTRWSLSMGTATLESSGQYSCSGKVAYVPYLGRQTSELVKVQVQGESPAQGGRGWGWDAAQGSGL